MNFDKVILALLSDVRLDVLILDIIEQLFVFRSINVYVFVTAFWRNINHFAEVFIVFFRFSKVDI